MLLDQNEASLRQAWQQVATTQELNNIKGIHFNTEMLHHTLPMGVFHQLGATSRPNGCLDRNSE